MRVFGSSVAWSCLVRIDSGCGVARATKSRPAPWFSYVQSLLRPRTCNRLELGPSPSDSPRFAQRIREKTCDGLRNSEPKSDGLNTLLLKSAKTNEAAVCN